MSIEFYKDGIKSKPCKFTINPKISKTVYKLKDGNLVEEYNPELARILRENMLIKIGKMV